MQLARLFSRMGGRTRDDKISGPFNWDELERVTARLGVLHGRLETAQAVGHHGTVNTVKRGRPGALSAASSPITSAASAR